MKNLKFNFGKSKVSQSQKTKMVQNVFNKVTKKYNLMNDIMSFGTHRLWKKRLIQVMNIQSNDLILDESISLFEEGMIITKQCRNYLNDAKLKIKNIIKKNGDIELEDFEKDNLR